jgi:hypothetical protein
MADLTLEQQQAIAIAEAKMKMAQSQQQPQQTQQPNDDLSWEKIKQGVSNIVPSALLGAAKPFYGLNQAAWQLAGKVAPSVANMGDWPVEMLNKRQAALNAEAGPVVSKFTTEPAALVGENVLPMAGMNKVAGAIGEIPSFAKTMGANALTGAAVGYATPEKTGLTPEQFANEKAKTVASSAALNIVPEVVGGAGNLLGSLLRKSAGISTGAGEEAFKQAYKAGKTGNEEFIANMRGQAPMENVLNDAKSNLSTMRAEKNAAYRSGMEDISADKSILNFDNIDSKIKEAADIGSYKGQTTNPNAIKALQEIKKSVTTWKKLDPAEYHTPEGMDALKQRIGAILEDIPYGTKARTVAEDIYHSVKSTINEQAPVYSNVMKDYSESSDLIKEIEKSLSLGKKSSVATGLNKLQSLMRNNVNTNYGYRQELANKLMEQGGKDIMPALAGQAVSSWTPRGLVGQGLDAGALLGILGGATHIPATMATMATTSPRLMGEAMYKAGQVAGKVPNMTEEQKQLAKLLMIRASQGAANE